MKNEKREEKRNNKTFWMMTAECMNREGGIGDPSAGVTFCHSNVPTKKKEKERKK